MSTRDQPMNFFRSEKISPIEEKLAAVSEVEAGIRDFVRSRAKEVKEGVDAHKTLIDAASEMHSLRAMREDLAAKLEEFEQLTKRLK